MEGFDFWGVADKLARKATVTGQISRRLCGLPASLRPIHPRILGIGELQKWSSSPGVSSHCNYTQYTII